MTFEEYLTQKKIDTSAFRKGDERQWIALEHIFLQMHPKSFTAQKLYLINPLRRRYPLIESTSTGNDSQKRAVRPRPKPKS